ncbi:hd domain-containing [Pyrenophora seminiperda CCB06]|uniref:Hd domain-containing n=1 Tax=Pyrenophora seminiperda CCB06 TaxID=1302712 RepID=A0A3M7LY20_9PLEO|nr:hd domain-containing [Pyrenophora seminiperda CCB06]
MAKQQSTKHSRVGKVARAFHRRMFSLGKSRNMHPNAIDNKTTPKAVASTSTPPSPSTIDYEKLNKRDTRLLSIDRLMDGKKVSDKDRTWFAKINMAVRELMNSPVYDASHDYEHIQRVVMIAHRLWMAEKHRDEFSNVDPFVIFVAAMVHDVGDEKYLSANVEAAGTDEEKRDRQRDNIAVFIKKCAPECPPLIWGPAAHIASLISFSREIQNPSLIAEQCAAYPALQIVQDADRLDSMGALGLARCSVYSGANVARGTGTVRRVIEIAEARFSPLPGLMKTHTGRREAAKRWEEMKEILSQMAAQADCEDVLEDF